MPIDPMTGQYMPYTAGTQQQPGLGMRMLENAPGITASVGFSSMRGSNTMMYGGGPRAKRASDFIGSSSRRRAAMASGKTPFLKRAFANNNPLNPRNLFRYSDTSIFAAQGAGMYTPFAASGFLGERKFVKNALGMADETGSVLGPGLLSAISAGRKADRLERKYQRLNNGNRLNQKRAGLVGRKLGKVDRTSMAIANMNRAPTPARPIPSALGRVSMGSRTPLSNGTILGSLPHMPNPYAGTAAGPAMFPARAAAPGIAPGSAVGARGNYMASNLAGVGTQKAAGFVRGAMGFAEAGGFTSASARGGAERAVSLFDEALKAKGFTGPAMTSQRVLEQGIFKSGAGRALLTSQGAKVGAARALGLALPGLQVVAAASFMYDVGKMAGTAVKGSIDLAKDSIKSMQGSIYKPMFGMGYNDTEAAATSRARGVMAIQNSRLNARSVLGYEAGTMAAHFG